MADDASEFDCGSVTALVIAVAAVQLAGLDAQKAETMSFVRWCHSQKDPLSSCAGAFSTRISGETIFI
jgi:hypothetical protein